MYICKCVRACVSIYIYIYVCVSTIFVLSDVLIMSYYITLGYFLKLSGPPICSHVENYVSLLFSK